MWGISRLAEKLLASQEGLYSMELKTFPKAVLKATKHYRTPAPALTVTRVCQYLKHVTRVGRLVNDELCGGGGGEEKEKNPGKSGNGLIDVLTRHFSCREARETIENINRGSQCHSRFRPSTSRMQIKNVTAANFPVIRFNLMRI
jgi:hypothetical protein